MKRITLFTPLFFYSLFVLAQAPCGNISTLDCNQISVNLPIELAFDENNSGILSTGFTMVVEPSSRLASDDAVADTNVPGYAPSLITKDGDGLKITSTKGILFSQLSGIPNSTETNSQMNALGVGFDSPNQTFNINLDLLAPNFQDSNGNTGNAQQAGIYFGLDEDHYAKLVLFKVNGTTVRVQLQVEDIGGTGINEINSVNFSNTNQEITLRMELDPILNVVKGFYTNGNGAEIQVGGSSGSLNIPPLFFDGVVFDGGTSTSSFAGVFTSQRRAPVAETFVTTFKSFSIIGPSSLSNATDVTVFTVENQLNTSVIDSNNHTITLELPAGTDITALTPTIALSPGATIAPLSGTAQDFSAPFEYTVTAEDGNTTQVWTVTVTQE
ncbi:MAG: DUF5018 domain-containing protein, partial [Croceivirga sp.]